MLFTVVFYFFTFSFCFKQFFIFSFFRPNNKLSTKFLFSCIPINSIYKNLNLYACDILFEAYWRRSIGKTISINIFYKFLVCILFWFFDLKQIWFYYQILKIVFAAAIYWVNCSKCMRTFSKSTRMCKWRQTYLCDCVVRVISF